MTLSEKGVADGVASLDETGKVPSTQLPNMSIDAYTKSQSLTSATSSQFGLDETAVPDDVLSWLGKYNEYWWSALHGQASSYTKYGSNAANLTSDIALVYPANLSSKETYTISYSEKISCDATGVNLASPTTREFTNSTSSSGIKTLRNSIEDFFNSMPSPCYISCSVSTVAGVFYLPSGSTIENSSSASYTATVTIFGSSDDPGVSVYLCAKDSRVAVKPQSVTLTSEIVTIPAGETTYEHSTDRNAYPDSGTQDGITYTYLGVPFEKFPSAPQIETGSYTGTGTYGSSNPNSLTFGFAPKLVLISTPMPKQQSTNYYQAYFVYNCTSTYSHSGNFSSSFAPSEGYAALLSVTWNNNTLSWYFVGSSSQAAAQLNQSGYKYYYVALG